MRNEIFQNQKIVRGFENYTVFTFKWTERKALCDHQRVFFSLCKIIRIVWIYNFGSVCFRGCLKWLSVFTWKLTHLTRKKFKMGFHFVSFYKLQWKLPNKSSYCSFLNKRRVPGRVKNNYSAITFPISIITAFCVPTLPLKYWNNFLTRTFARISLHTVRSLMKDSNSSKMCFP